jgi:hypothetical protein
MAGMDELSAQDFIAAARALCLAAVGSGLVAPSFRSPPRRRDTTRTIRRYEGGAVVAVRRLSRPAIRVLADMVDGVLAASSVHVDARARARPELLRAACEAVGRPAPVAAVPEPAAPADSGVAERRVGTRAAGPAAGGADEAARAGGARPAAGRTEGAVAGRAGRAAGPVAA